MALVHTACGRSESKYLRPTLAGHVEGCPVIALCRPGSPRRAGRGPVSCDSGPSSLATQHWAGARGTGTPPPHPWPSLFPSATLKTLPHLCQVQSGQEFGVLCPCSPSPSAGGWGGSGGSLSHTALDRKSSWGWGEESPPEKIQQEREAEGALAPKTTVSH